MEIVHTSHGIAHGTHTHQAYELIYVLTGRIRVSFGTQVYEAGPQSLICIGHLEAHAVEALVTPYERYFFILPKQETDGLVQDSLLLSLLSDRPVSFRHVLDVHTLEGELRYLFAALDRALAAPDAPYAMQYAGCLLRLLLMTLYRRMPRAFPVATGDQDSPIRRAQHIIDTQFTKPLSIQSLADMCYMSVSRLSHKFREQIGYSPRHYLTLTRLAHARALLAHEGVTVTEAALCAGFSDVNNFIRRYKAEYGNTPHRDRAIPKEGVDA